MKHITARALARRRAAGSMKGMTLIEIMVVLTLLGAKLGAHPGERTAQRPHQRQASQQSGEGARRQVGAAFEELVVAGVDDEQVRIEVEHPLEDQPHAVGRR